jgi:hypothetical protein
MHLALLASTPETGPIKSAILDAVGRGFGSRPEFWTRIGGFSAGEFAPGPQSVQPVNPLYFSMTLTAAFAGPNSVAWTPTAFDAETK